jgi:hypothetical protein
VRGGVWVFGEEHGCGSMARKPVELRQKARGRAALTYAVLRPCSHICSRDSSFWPPVVVLGPLLAVNLVLQRPCCRSTVPEYTRIPCGRKPAQFYGVVSTLAMQEGGLEKRGGCVAICSLGSGGRVPRSHLFLPVSRCFYRWHTRFLLIFSALFVRRLARRKGKI